MPAAVTARRTPRRRPRNPRRLLPSAQPSSPQPPSAGPASDHHPAASNPDTPDKFSKESRPTSAHTSTRPACRAYQAAARLPGRAPAGPARRPERQVAHGHSVARQPRSESGARRATRSTTPSWTCPHRSRPSNTAQPSSRLKINGELVVWTGERLDFDALQRRMVNKSATVRRRLVVEEPASFVAFDVLAVDGVDIRNTWWSIRRRRLESLAEN